MDGITTTMPVAALGLSVTIVCLAADRRNYYKFRQISDPHGGHYSAGVVTWLLTLFYIAWINWFAFLALEAAAELNWIFTD